MIFKVQNLKKFKTIKDKNYTDIKNRKDGKCTCIIKKTL